VAKTPELTGMLDRSQNGKLGVWLFLGGEIVLFSSLILTQVLARIQHGNYSAFKEHLNIPLVGANTFVLIVSSLLVVLALSAIRRGNRPHMRAALMGVIVAGMLFLGGQAVEWAALFRDGVTAGDEYGSYFYTITGVHGTHVLIGVIWASFVLVRSLQSIKDARFARSVESFGLYWHFVDVVWIVLFTLFYLVP
jgi:heme/copper-type cytochrome/quinol oxidase subunit 3